LNFEFPTTLPRPETAHSLALSERSESNGFRSFAPLPRSGWQIGGRRPGW